MAKYKKPYVDSSGWIAWATGQVENGVDRAAIMVDILKAAERGDFKIYISAFTLAEVHKVRGSGLPRISEEDEDKILAFFEHDYIIVIDVDRRVGQQAQRLCREHPELKPADAIHLASALRAGCDALLAWDRPLTDIERTDIRLEAPEMVRGQLEIDDALESA